MTYDVLNRITVGGVTLKVESESTTRVRIDELAGDDHALDNTILKASAELLRKPAETDPRLPAEQLSKLIRQLPANQFGVALDVRHARGITRSVPIAF